jgi:hypothetical protein
MEDSPLTRAYLESLANADLLKLADNMGIDISQNTDRVFLIEELLEVSSLDKDESNTPDDEMTDLVFVESAPLPRYYNVTFIEVMIRDPFWAFVFWEIKASEKEQLEKAQDFNGYYLRVNLLNEVKLNDANKTEAAGFSDRHGREALAMEEMLSVQVSPTDTAWYLGFAPTIETVTPVENEAMGPEENQSKTGQNQGKTDQNRYIVELCASIGENEIILAVSSPIRMPGLPELPKRAGERDPEVGENQLVRLSGYGDFHVLRRNERPLRAKKDVRSE